MKKYIVKIKGGSKPFGEYNSREEASIKVLEYINEYNECVEGDYFSPFDFTLEEVECKEVNEVITDFESAKKYLVGNTSIDSIKDAEILIKELNPKHIEALIALNRLFTIAEAWNKIDGFIPDFSDCNQDKWFPSFYYDEDAAELVYMNTNYACTYAGEIISTRICFKSYARAEQFGKQFAELYNKAFYKN